MSEAGEFHYRLRRRVGSHRPGSHPGSSLGAGDHFAGHARLFDVPDPRRIDLRASLKSVPREWQVRVHRQRAATPVYAVVDTSGSMHFGAHESKLSRAANFVESMGYSAYRAGDPAGLIAADIADPAEAKGAAGAAVTHLPARHGRGIGRALADRLRAQPVPGVAPAGGLLAALAPLAGREALVFLVSDFQWPLDALGDALGLLQRSSIVPLVLWDRAETEPPAGSGLLGLEDAESFAHRSLWVGDGLRMRWRAQVENRRRAIDAVFAAHDLRPLYLLDAFDPTLLSRYFLEDYA